MTKRKFTKNGEKPVRYQCTNKECKWEGKDEEKLEKRMIIHDNDLHLVCPECGRNEFFGLLE